MKTLALALLAVAFGVSVVFAAGTPAPKGKDQPCLRIEQICKDAGFVKGGAKEGIGLIVNCVQPILAGKSILGVTVDAATIQACRNNIQTRRPPRGKAKAAASKSK